MYLVWLVVKHYKISITNIEAGQVVTRVLCVKNILVNHEGCSSRFCRVSSKKNNDTKTCAKI